MIVTRLLVRSVTQNLGWEAETYCSVQPRRLFGDKPTTQGLGYMVGSIKRSEQPRIAEQLYLSQPIKKSV